MIQFTPPAQSIDHLPQDAQGELIGLVRASIAHGRRGYRANAVAESLRWSEAAPMRGISREHYAKESQALDQLGSLMTYLGLPSRSTYLIGRVKVQLYRDRFAMIVGRLLPADADDEPGPSRSEEIAQLNADYLRSG